MEIIAAMAFLMGEKKTADSQNPQTIHVQWGCVALQVARKWNFACCSLCFPDWNEKIIMFLHLVTKKQDLLEWFLRIEKTHLELQNPITGVLLVDGFMAETPEPPQSPARANLQGHEQAAGFITLGWDTWRWHDEMVSQSRNLLCQHALHFQVPVVHFWVLECWKLIRREHVMQRWSLILVGFCCCFC